MHEWLRLLSTVKQVGRMKHVLIQISEAVNAMKHMQHDMHAGVGLTTRVAWRECRRPAEVHAVEYMPGNLIHQNIYTWDTTNYKYGTELLNTGNVYCVYQPTTSHPSHHH